MHNFLSLWLLVLLSVSATSVRAEERWNESVQAELLEHAKLQSVRQGGYNRHHAPMDFMIIGLGIGVIAKMLIPKRFALMQHASFVFGMTTAVYGAQRLIEDHDAYKSDRMRDDRLAQRLSAVLSLMDTAVLNVLVPTVVEASRETFSEDTLEQSYPHWPDFLASQMLADENIGDALRAVCAKIHGDLAQITSEFPSPAAWARAFVQDFAVEPEPFVGACVLEMRKAFVEAVPQPSAE